MSCNYPVILLIAYWIFLAIGGEYCPFIQWSQKISRSVCYPDASNAIPMKDFPVKVTVEVHGVNERLARPASFRWEAKSLSRSIVLLQGGGGPVYCTPLKGVDSNNSL